MATTEGQMVIQIEGFSLNEAAADLLLAHERLAKRHGADFRALERTIEDIAEDPADYVEMHWMGDGSIMAAPAGRLTEALREARRLGVLN